LGVFDDPELQALYTKLIHGGSESLIDALRVGVFIEITDIADLTPGDRNDHASRHKNSLYQPSKRLTESLGCLLLNLGKTWQWHGEPYELTKP